MGALCSQPLSGIISNATPYPLQVIITSKTLQTTSVTTTNAWNIGGNVTNLAPGTNVNLAGNTTAGLTLQTRAQTFLVHPGCFNKRILSFNIKRGEQYFMTVVVLKPQGEERIVEDIHLTSDAIARNCFWVKDGELSYTEVAKGRLWRFAADSNRERNYPPGKMCHQCGHRLRCRRGCPILDIAGGLSQLN